MMQRYTKWILTAILLTTVPATSHAAVADCAAILSIDKKENYKADPREVKQCIQRGFDPPVSWRPNNGKSPGIRVGGARGFGYGTVQAPPNSPGAVGAAANVSPNLINFIAKYLKSTNSQAGTNVGDTNFCPAETDPDGIYGSRYSPTTTATSLSCGASLPMSSYELVLNPNPNALAVTRHASYYIWLFQKSGTTYNPIGNEPVKLPTFLCKLYSVPDEFGGVTWTRKKSVDLNPPIAQAISYNQATNEFLIRLIPKSMGGVKNDELVEDPTMPEKYLRIPVVGGVPQVPYAATAEEGDNNCPLEDEYYREKDSLKMDMVIHSALRYSCEGVPAVESGSAMCSGPLSRVMPILSCNTLTLYPTGSPSDVVCDGKVQYAVLNNTNLVYPPGTSAQFNRVASHPSSPVFENNFTAPTTAGSRVYAQSQTIIEVSRTSPSLTFHEGMTLIMMDRSRLVTNGPTVLNPSSNQVTMTGGAVLVDSTGKLIKRFNEGDVYTAPPSPAGATYQNPYPVIPLRLQLGSSLTMPAGYSLLLNERGPYVRLPIDKPE